MGANSSDKQQLEELSADKNDQQQQQQQHAVISSLIRSYKCSFCDRGFSNAQALGGHMNVHRRDRAAKFNASSSTSSDHSNQSQLLPWIISPRTDQEGKEDDDIDHVIRQHYHHKHQQLPCLFVDTEVPSSRLISCKLGTHEDDHKELDDDPDVIITKRQPIQHQSSSSSHGHDHLADHNDDRKLDLELRLGPDPDEVTGTMSITSTTTTTTTTTGKTRSTSTTIDFF